MIIYGKCENVNVIDVRSKVGVKDPSKVYYTLCVYFPDSHQNGELNCNEEIFKAVSGVASEDIAKRFSTVFDFETAYNMDREYFYLSRVLDCRSSKSGK